MGTGNKAGFGTKPRDLSKPQGKHPDDVLTEQISAALDQLEENRKLKTDVLIPFIELKGTQYLDQWLLQMISAKSDASTPVEEEAEKHWFVALAGNLLWAASVFVPAANVVKVAAAAGKIAVNLDKTITIGQTLYDTLTVVSTVGGSMALNPEGIPSGKDVVADILNDKRKALGDQFKKNIDRYASELIRSGQFTAEKYRSAPTEHLKAVGQMLWANIFPQIPFEGWKEIYKSGLAAITGALKQFNAQYRMWREAVQRWSTRHDPNARLSSFQGPVETRGKQPVTYQERVRYHEERYPFKAQLDFGAR